MALSDLGFSPTQEKVYGAVLDQPDLDVADLAVIVGSDEVDVTRTLARLVELGLARPDQRRRCGFSLVNPAVAVADLIEHVEHDLLCLHRRVVETRTELVDLAARFAQATSRTGAVADVGYVSGAESIGEAIAELSFFTRRSVYTVHMEGFRGIGLLDPGSPLHRRTLRRGTDLRILCHRELLADEGEGAMARELEAAGASYRVTAQQPDPMVIMDERVAVVPVDARDLARGALVVRQPALLNGFVRLYQRMWGEGKQVAWGDETESPPSDADRRVLALLADGHTDEVIARDIGCSARHLRRRIAVLMNRLDASSRFEAGVVAAKKGWL